MSQRIWPGNLPKSRWTEAIEVGTVYGVRWVAYCRPANAGWIDIKLIAVPGAPIKANYWLAWHPDEQRFARRADQGKLANGRPALLESLRTQLLTHA